MPAFSLWISCDFNRPDAFTYAGFPVRGLPDFLERVSESVKLLCKRASAVSKGESAESAAVPSVDDRSNFLCGDLAPLPLAAGTETVAAALELERCFAIGALSYEW